MKQLLTVLVFLVSTSFTAQAEQTRFVMSAPGAVEVGKQFRLTFTLNEQGSNLTLPPDLTQNFEVLMGPSTSSSTSMQIINGKATTETSFSYIFILRAKEEGTFEIRPASIVVDNQIFQSNSLTIQVVKAQSQQAQPQAADPDAGTQNIDLGAENLFVRVEMDKRNVYRGEQIIATVKLYVDPNITLSGFDEVNLPAYEGFYTQDIAIPQQINFTREVYNDRIYQTGVLKKTVLFPQQNGKITIDPFNLSLLIQQRVKPRSFFDDFFSGYRTVKTTITSSPVSVNVKNLPPEPATFYGGVGSFNITSDISNLDVTTNDAVTLTVKIIGNGNIRLIRTPELELPQDFEKYDPRASDDISTGANGVSGTKTIEYLFQPRFEGDYTIPSMKFTYFNPATGSYVTKSTEEYTLHVEKGSQEQSATVVSSLRKEDVQLIGKDIRFIKQGNPQFRDAGEMFYGSTGFYSVYAGSTLLFLVMVAFYRRKARENANIALVRNRKANRLATRRLKAAADYMKQNNDGAFHEAILKAFWGYLSDKLSIPVAELNRENAIMNLQNRNVDQEVIDDFVEITEQCEFARYAPAGGSGARADLYKKAVSTMSRLEKQIKR